MNALLVIGARWFGAACALAVVYAVVMVVMAATDRRRTEAERKQQRERDFWRTVKADPRKSKRGNWRPPNGFAA